MGDRQASTPGAYDPVARAGADGRGRHLRAGRVPQRRRPRRPGPRRGRAATPRCASLCLEIFNDANAEMQAESGNRLLPMAILPAWDIDACVREAERGSEPRPARREPHVGPAGPGRARPREPRVGPAVGGVQLTLELPVHFHIGASLTTMNFFGTYPWESHDDDTKLAIGGTLLFIGNARVRRQHHLLGDARPLPRAEDRVGRERRRLGPVHPRGARLRDGRRTRRRTEGAAVAVAVGVLQAPDLRDDVVRAHRTSPSLVAAVGEDNILFETDFPHPTCLYPDPLKTARDNMRELSPDGAAQDPRRATRRSSTGSDRS